MTPNVTFKGVTDVTSEVVQVRDIVTIDVTSEVVQVRDIVTMKYSQELALALLTRLVLHDLE